MLNVFFKPFFSICMTVAGHALASTVTKAKCCFKGVKLEEGKGGQGRRKQTARTGKRKEGLRAIRSRGRNKGQERARA